MLLTTGGKGHLSRYVFIYGHDEECWGTCYTSPQEARATYLDMYLSMDVVKSAGGLLHLAPGGKDHLSRYVFYLRT
jgi:hypothetical protein